MQLARVGWLWLALSTTSPGRAAYLCAMARPRTYEEPRLATAIRLPALLHLRLRLRARARQISATLLVEQAMADFLANFPSLQSTLGTAR